MRAYDNITIYTADDEEPRCGRCDNVCDGADELCVEGCGAAHCWGGYTRTVIESENIEQGAYVRGFEQGRTQGRIDAQGEPMSTIKAEWTNADALNLQPACNQLATDCIRRQAAIDAIRAEFEYVYCYNCDHEGNEEWCEDCHRKYMKWSASRNTIDRVLNGLPSAQPEIIRCKDCKHYHTDVFGGELGLEGVYENLIVAHDACDRWSEYMNSVDPDGFCFLAERRTDETD